MGYESPNVTLIDGSGNILPVQNAVSIPASTPALLAAGSDGTASRFVAVDSSGRLVVVGAGTAGTPAGGVISIQGVASGTAIPVSGTVTATNASVSTTGSAPPASATYIGASVTTSAPTYTTGQMSALSLTTAGLLRIDGSGVTQPVSGTVTANQGTANTLANAWGVKVTDGTNTMPTGDAIGRALFHKITDGTNTVTVMGAFATPSGAEPALTVAISPNGVLKTKVSYDFNAAGNLNALNATVNLNIGDGSYGIGFILSAGSLVGTIVPEISIDGISFISTYFIDPTNGKQFTSVVFGSSNTLQQLIIANVPGATAVRVRVSVYTSGSALCYIDSTTTIPNLMTLENGSIGSTTLPPFAGQVGGSVTTSAPTYTNATFNALSLTTTGSLRIDGSGSTQPVSGTITANIGTSGSLALDASVNGILVSQGSTTSGEKGPLVQGAVTTAAPTYTTAQTSPLSLTTAGALRIDGSGSTQPVSGTVTVTQGTAANLKAQTASEFTTAASTGTVATLIGGAVTTSAPTYTTGQMDPLSLTTTGLLRIDGSGVTQPVSGTVTANIGTSGSLALDATLAKLTIIQGTALGSNTQAMVGASVTTSAPTYTTGQISPFSLTTAGALRIDGSGSTQPVSGTVTANIGTSGSLALDATVAKLTITQGTALGSNTQALMGASVTTAVPSYTTGQISPLSLTTSGQLRSLTDITTATGALGALNNAVTVSTAGQFGVGMQLTAGTLVGTILAEISFDNGTTWIGTEFTDPTTDLNQVGIIFGSSNTAQTQSIILAPGTTNTRVRVSAYTSGTANCTVSATTALTDTLDFSASAGSSNFPANIAYVGGSVSTIAPSYSTGTVNALSLNVAGGLRTDGSGVVQPTTINNTVGTGSLAALNAAVTIACSGTNSYGFFYNTTNFSGTIIAEISLDGGINWFSNASLTSYQSGVIGTSIVLTGTSSSATRGIVTQYGTTNVRIRASVYTSGTVSIQINGTTGVGPQLIMGSVQTSAPTYTTGTLNNVSLDTVGNLRTLANAGTGTFTTQDTSSLVDNAAFTDGTSRVLPTGYIVDETAGTALTENDVGASRMDFKRAQINALEDFNTRGSRLAVSGSGSLRNTNETNLWNDAAVGAINAFWTQSTTTQTIANSNGYNKLNNSGITTLNTFSILTSVRQFPIRNSKQAIFTRIRATLTANAASNHSLVELGFGTPSGVTAVISNGAFFRWRADGTLAVVISSNSSENVTQVLAQGVISVTNVYNYDITIYNDYIHFVVTTPAVPLINVVDTKIAIPAVSVGTGLAFLVSHLPIFARSYVDATGGGTAISTLVGSTVVQILDSQTNMSWEAQSAATMRQASIDPTSYAQTGGSMTAAPGTITPSNTAAGTTTLGGDFAIAMTVASENPLSVFTYTVPSPYTFFLEGLIFSTPFATTALALTGAPILEWLIIANCATSNISTGGGQRVPIGLNMTASATLAIGAFWTINGNLIWKPQTPIACLPGTILHIGYKVFITTVATTPGVTRGSVFVDGFFM